MAEEICEDCGEDLDLHCDECGDCNCEGECVDDDEDDEEESEQ